MKKYKYLLSIAFCLILVGYGNNISINEDITEKTIFQQGAYYYIEDSGVAKRIEIYDHRNFYAIFDYCQSEHGINAFATRKYPKNMGDILRIFNTRVPTDKKEQYLILVRPQNRIHSVSINRIPYAMKWIDNEQIILQMNLDGKKSLIMNKYGRIVNRIDYAIIKELEFIEILPFEQ